MAQPQMRTPAPCFSEFSLFWEHMLQAHPIQNGTTMFITTNTKGRRKVFSHAPYAHEAIETLYRVQACHPFFLYGFVIMPDHAHLLLYVPEGKTISTIIRQWKSGVSFNIGQGAIWQSRFDLRIPKNRSAALHYIHQNPIKSGLVEKPELYPWSSASGRWDVADFLGS